MKIQCHIVHPDHRKIPYGFRKMLETTLGAEENLHDNITIILCNDTMIRRLNREFLHNNSATDVLSFNLNTQKSDNLLGEVYVNLDHTRKQAQEFGVTFWNELVRLTIHGILHLYGYNDNTKIAEQRMTKRQEELVLKCQGRMHW